MTGSMDTVACEAAFPLYYCLWQYSIERRFRQTVPVPRCALFFFPQTRQDTLTWRLLEAHIDSSVSPGNGCGDFAHVSRCSLIIRPPLRKDPISLLLLPSLPMNVSSRKIHRFITSLGSANSQIAITHWPYFSRAGTDLWHRGHRRPLASDM